MKDQTREELIRRSAALDSLSKHPDYPELLKEIERRKERDLKRLVADHLKSGKPVDQRVFDYTSGWWDALDWAVGLPDKAKDTLERALRETDRKDNR